MGLVPTAAGRSSGRGRCCRWPGWCGWRTRPNTAAGSARVADDLMALQDASGGDPRVIGGGGRGTAARTPTTAPAKRALIQTNGDPVCDMLYTCNFALIGLHEAAAATGDPFYAEAEEKLAKFLCRIQVRSEAHPDWTGPGIAAFNFRNWDYWASNADWEWGPWCTETGWTQPWIAGTLALRQMKTSLWDLTKDAAIEGPTRKRRQPDAARRGVAGRGGMSRAGLFLQPEWRRAFP